MFKKILILILTFFILILFFYIINTKFSKVFMYPCDYLNMFILYLNIFIYRNIEVIYFLCVVNFKENGWAWLFVCSETFYFLHRHNKIKDVQFILKKIYFFFKFSIWLDNLSEYYKNNFEDDSEDDFTESEDQDYFDFDTIEDYE